MIERDEHDGVRVLRLAHGKANALDSELCPALTHEFERLEADGAPGVVLTARGTIFSAGVDLLRASEGGAGYLRRFLPELIRCFEALFFYGGPLVCALNGHAIAGGCILACAGDVRLLARGSARIGVPELLVGVPFPAIALETMRYAAPPNRFQELVFGGATYAGDDAVAMGLADAIVEPDALLVEAVRAVRRLCAIPRLTFETTKRQLRDPARRRVEALGELYDADVVDAWAHPATLDNVRAYVARTLKKN